MSPCLRTPLHTLLPNLRVPLVLGPMANASSGLLASCVSHAGGLGFIGAGYYTPSKLSTELEVVYEKLGRPPRGSGNRLDIGVGFLAWKLTEMNKGQLPPSLGASDLDTDSQALQLIDVALKAKPRAVWLSFGSSEEMRGWSRILREREAAWNGGGKMKWGDHLKLFIGVGDVAQAQEATEDLGADVVAVTGIEAGGHGLSTSPPLSSLLPLVKAKLSTWSPSNPSNTRPLLLGAGGLHNGSSLLSTLALGADGAVFGTRFLLTPEAAYNDAQKDVLQRAVEGHTVRSMAFDEARGTLGWPDRVDGRGVMNQTVRDYLDDAGDAGERRKRYKEAEAQGDPQRIVTWAGTGVGNVDEIKPAEDIVKEIEVEVIEQWNRLKGFYHETD